MGRSQVARNQRKGRGRGRGDGGGDGGRGGRGSSSAGGRGSSSGSRRHKGGADPRKLGDNAFRFERATSGSTSAGGSGESHYDGLLDDINFMSAGGGGLGEYYGDSHYAANEEEEGLADNATLSVSAATQKNEVEDWMAIDTKALDRSLKQIPIHERLKVPLHIGEHLENMYGLDGRGGGRSKTLAELREESKCIGISSENEPAAKVISPNENAEENSEHNSPAKTTQPDNNLDNSGDASDGGADDEEEDLEAWLDDMIA